MHYTDLRGGRTAEQRRQPKEDSEISRSRCLYQIFAGEAWRSKVYHPRERVQRCKFIPIGTWKTCKICSRLIVFVFLMLYIIIQLIIFQLLTSLVIRWFPKISSESSLASYAQFPSVSYSDIWLVPSDSTTLWLRASSFNSTCIDRKSGLPYQCTAWSTVSSW